MEAGDWGVRTAGRKFICLGVVQGYECGEERGREGFLGSGAKLGLGENGTFEFVGAFFTGIIGTAGYLPSVGEWRVKIYLCVDAD